MMEMEFPSRPDPDDLQSSPPRDWRPDPLRARARGYDVANMSSAELEELWHQEEEAAAARRVSDDPQLRVREDEWEDPTPLVDADRPPFPVNVFPSWCADFVEAVARETQTPTDLAGLLILAALAVPLAGKVRIRSRWFEPVNVYVVVVLPPGERKSPVFRRVMEPLERLEELRVEAWRTELAAATAEHKLAQDRVKVARKRATEDGAGDDTRQALVDAEQALQAAELRDAPKLIVSDITPEKLVDTLAEQGGRLALLDEEATIFQIMSGRYQGALNIEAFLKAHDGGQLRRDRVNKDVAPVIVKNPALTLGLTVQPDVLKGLSEHKAFRGRGLIARFLFAVPTSMLGRRDITPAEVEPWLEAAYTARVADLDTVREGTLLRLDDAAETRFVEYRCWHETQLGPLGDLHPYADWASKLPGALLRIAALLHLAGGGSEAAATPISLDTIERVIELSAYLIPHAKHAIALIHDNERLELAAKCWAWIDKTDADEVRFRDLQRGVHEEAEEVERAVEALAERHLVRLEERAAQGRGGRPSRVLVVNPKARAAMPPAGPEVHS